MQSRKPKKRVREENVYNERQANARTRQTAKTEKFYRRDEWKTEEHNGDDDDVDVDVE